MATTTKKAEITFDGTHLHERARKNTWSVAAKAISAVEFGEYSWATKPGWDRDAKYFLHVSYGQPTEQWNGVAMAVMGQGREWNFPKSQGDAVRALYSALLKATT